MILLFFYFYKCYNVINLFYICFIMYIYMIFDEVFMFDFRGFFLFCLIVCDFNMFYMIVYLILFYFVCVVYKFL